MFVMGAPFHQVLTTSVDTGDNQYRLNIFSIDASGGDLSTVATLVPTDKVVLSSGTAYAAPLCTDRDGDHVYVVYPAENVSEAEWRRCWSSITCSIGFTYAAERMGSEGRMPSSTHVLSLVHKYEVHFTRYFLG